MGKDPAFFADDMLSGHPRFFDFENGTRRTKTIVGDKTYLIREAEDENLCVEVQIFDPSLRKWVYPTVLGPKPVSYKGHSAVLLKDRILIIIRGSELDDHTWFLEVDTLYVRQQKEILKSEVVAWSKGVIGNPPTPVVITGPSGVGKGTLISMLMKEFPSTFGFSVSHTTRARRGIEKDGVHYHFTEKIAMEKDIKGGKFLEFASVHGNLYGTSVEAVELVADSGKRCILDIDVQGAKSARATSLDATFIFICPPSMEELQKRLRDRGTETEEQISKRLKNAEAEIVQGRSPGLFDFILYNDSLEECYERLKKLLGIDAAVSAQIKPATTQINLPTNFSVTKVDDRIMISSICTGQEKQSKNSIMLDVSSLKGGAPGRTRGLSLLRVMDSHSGAMSGMDQLG